ncbi:MAG: KH domain-containing protein [Clostridia bacterium]|nr:KH domain-containing protein [Clostridia bacterium]
MTDLKQVLTDIAKALVDNPDQVEVIVLSEDDDEIVFRLIVAESDMGKVIGRNGRIAKAIRTVMKSVSNTEGKRVDVKIG